MSTSDNVTEKIEMVRSCGTNGIRKNPQMSVSKQDRWRKESNGKAEVEMV